MIGSWHPFVASGDQSDTHRQPWSGWRRLAGFWAIVIAVLAAGGGTLQVLGPPERNVRPIIADPSQQSSALQEPSLEEPDIALREQAPQAIGGYLPRIANDGSQPMRVFAAPFDHHRPGPRVALIIAGIGMNEADSLSAARALPKGFVFALSPYVGNPGRMISEIRDAGHEVLLSIPMEPNTFPLNDPGSGALMTDLSPEDNVDRLHRIMARAGTYVGMTNALGPMQGERFSSMHDLLAIVLWEAGRRGLIFVDTRADADRNTLSWHRQVDLVVDDSPTEARVDQRLGLLARLARDRGSSLGLVTLPRPATVERIGAWANGLADRGMVLAPVSAIAVPPATHEDTK